MEKVLEQQDAGTISSELNVSRKYLISGFELDLDTLSIHIDQPHIEMLNALGHEHVPDTLHLLEYAERFIHADDFENIQNRVAYANVHRDDPNCYDRMEVKLMDASGQICFCIVNTWRLRPGIIKGMGQNITDLIRAKDFIQEKSESPDTVIDKYSIEDEVYFKSKQWEDLEYSIPGVLFILKMDIEGRRKVDFVSERINEFMMVSKQAALDSFSSFISGLDENDQIIFNEKLNFSLENKLPLDTEFRLRPELKPEFHCYMMQAEHRFNEDGTVVTYGSIHDITTQKKVELEVRKKHDDMLPLMKCLDEVVYVLDENDVFLEAYAEDTSLLFMDKSKMVGMNFADIFEGSVCDAYLNAKIELLEKNESENFQYSFVRNGELMNFSSRLIQVKESARLIFTAKNFTAELQDIENNKKFSKIVEEVSDSARFGFFTFDIATKEVFCSKNLSGMLGWDDNLSSTDLYSKFLESVHSDDVSQFEVYLREASESGRGYEWQHRLKNKNGEYIWFHSKLKTESDTFGNSLRLQGVSIDITQRKSQELMIQQKNSYYKAAFETMSEAVVITDANGMHVDSNDAAKYLLGFSEGQDVDVCNVLKQNGNVLIDKDGDEFSEAENPFNRVMLKNEIVKDVLMGVKSVDGAIKWASLNASAFNLSGEKDASGIALVFSNVDDKISLTKKLKESINLNGLLEKQIPSKVAFGLELTAQMLHLQKQFLTNDDAQVVLGKSASQIHALKQLYLFKEKANGLDMLNTASFFNAIVKKVLEEGNDKGVSLNVSLNTSNIQLPFNKALPLCLIVNEILSNSLRHAFEGKLTGDIRISFRRQGDYFIFELSDNGKGLPKQFNWEKSNTFGFRLIQKLLIQLKGAATFASDKGCKMMITFPA